MKERNHRRRWGKVTLGVIARARVVTETLHEREAMGWRRAGGDAEGTAGRCDDSAGRAPRRDGGSGARVRRVREAPAQPQADVHEAHEHGDLDEG